MTTGKPYETLRRAMVLMDIDQGYLGNKIGRSRRYVSQRFNGHEDWTQGDMYKILDLLHLDYKYMYIYFPREGKHYGQTA